MQYNSEQGPPPAERALPLCQSTLRFAMPVNDFIDELERRENLVRNSFAILTALLENPLNDTDLHIVERLRKFEQEIEERNLPYNLDQTDYIPEFFAGICSRAGLLVIAVDRQRYQGEDVRPAIEKLGELRMAFSAVRLSSPTWQAYCAKSPSGFDLAELDSSKTYSIRDSLAAELGVEPDDIIVVPHDSAEPFAVEAEDLTGEGPAKWAMGGFISEWSIDEKLSIVDYLLSRVSLEQAAWSGDYTAALHHLNGSLGLTNDILPSRPPWPLDGFGKRAILWCEELKKRREVDWKTVSQSFDAIRAYDDDLIVYWYRLMGWIENELTPNELRSIDNDRENAGAVKRLRRYCFSNRLWQLLPEDVQNYLIIADRTWMSAERDSMLHTVLNPLHRATEGILYRYLWLPLMQYADEQQLSKQDLHGFLTISDSLGKSAPGLKDYRQVLWTKAAKIYFNRLGIIDGSDDMRFLTNERRAPLHLQDLLNARNMVEYPTDAPIDPSAIRNLYAESLGIGRKGVLPELLRLLATGGRSTP